MKLKHLALAVATAFATFAQASHVRTPTETLFRPLMKGPIMTKTLSAANQWAGRTTISSGSASQVVSTSNVNSDSLISLGVEAALPAAYLQQGIVAFTNSAATYGTASTSAVYSGYAITLALQAETAVVSAGAGINAPLRINSIVDGVSFAISTCNSEPLGIAAPVAHWSIPRADVSKIKINSISSGGYFLLGWADGKPRPVDATVLWEIRRAS